VGETSEELQSYREKVIAEVERRMLRLRAIETDIERAKFAAEANNRSWALLSRDTGRNQAAAAHNKRLRERVQELTREREQAEADLDRAKVRLVEVDQRLEELGENPSGER
jgi:chromosome segregation ATPase